MKAQRGVTSTLSVNSALNGVGTLTPRPGRFTPEKTRYPLYKRQDGSQGQSGRVRKNLAPPPGIDPWAVQPVARYYTDYATPPHNSLQEKQKNINAQLSSVEFFLLD